MQFDGRVAVITGGGRGLGEAIARRLAGEGACVALLELTAPDGERVSSELRGARAAGSSVFRAPRIWAILARSTMRRPKPASSA